MPKKITVAESWSQLSRWQLQELANIFFNLSDDFVKDYQKMILILFQKKNTFMHQLRLKMLIRQVPISSLEPFAKFLLEKPQYYFFPEVPGLVKPADRLGDLTIKHFSVIDTLFHQWQEQKTTLALRRFVASLYRIDKRFWISKLIRKHYYTASFNSQLLPVVSQITDKLSVKEMEAIAFIYSNTRRYIWDRYPVIFPKSIEEKEDELKPNFRKKDVYTPFKKIIVGLAMDEVKPLGNLHECNKTLIYDFMDTLSESIIYHRNKAKANGQ